jgi:hypothetical protein
LENIDPSCTYCNLKCNLPPPRDSMSHCFFYCNTALGYLTDILSLTNVRLPINSREFLLLYWYGIDGSQRINNATQSAYTMFFDTFRYIFFKNRQRRHSPTSLEFKTEFVCMLKWICKFNKKIKAIIRCTFINTILLQAIG